MSLIKAEKGEHSSYSLEFSVDKATFEDAITKVYRKKAPQITVPGFRKGKAPRSVVEKIYGKAAFYEDAMNEVIPNAYEAAVKEAGIKPVGRPAFDVVSMDDGVVFSAKVDVEPEITIADYKGIAATKPAVSVTDDEVNAEIDIVRQRNAREIEITDHAAETGNTVKIDFEGFIDGTAFEGGKGEDHSLKLGSGQFIPGFEDQIVGHHIGDEFDVNVSFPADYHAEELAGKPAVFKTKLNAITRVELPELDDDFAKDASEFDTMDEYRADVRAKLEKRKAESADAEVEGQLADALIEKVQGEIPASMIEAETENYVRDYDSRLRAQGMDLNTYLKYTSMTLDQLRDQLRPNAEKRLKYRLALEKIAELEGIKVSDEEINAEIKKLADAYHMPEDQIKALVSNEDMGKDIAVRKAMDLVKADAVITDAPKAEENTAEAPKAEDKE